MSSPHLTRKQPRITEDVQILTGRRGPEDMEAVRWRDLDALSLRIAEQFIASNGRVLTELGGVGSDDFDARVAEVNQLIDATNTYIDNEVADLQQDVADTLAYIDSEVAGLQSDVDSLQADVATTLAYIDAEIATTTAYVDGEIANTLNYFDVNLSSVSDQITDVRDNVVPRLSSTEELIDDFIQGLTALSSLLHETNERIANAGIYVDPENGSVRIAALEQVDNRLSTAELNLDAVESEITARVTYTEMNDALSALVLDPSQIPIVSDLQIRMSSAEVRLDAAEAEILLKADNSTVSGIDVRLSSAEIDIDAIEQSITLLATSAEMDAVETRVTTAEVTLNALDVPAITQTVLATRAQFDELDESSMANLGALLTAYQDREAIRTDIGFARQQISAEVTDRREAIAQATTDLLALIDDNAALVQAAQVAIATGDEALAADLLALDALVSDNAAAITTETAARATADDAFAAQLTSLTSDVSGNTAAIANETVARSTADSAIALDVTTLETDVAGNLAGIAAEAAARSSADDALSALITSLETDVAGNTASITEESLARSTADSSIASQIASLNASVNANTAAIDSESSLRATEDDALAASISSLSTNVNSNTAGLSAEAAVRSTVDSAIAADITALETDVAGNTASITAETATRSAADSAIAADITALETTVGQNTAAISDESVARSTEDDALAATIATVQSSVDSNTAAITTEALTRTQEDNALASLIDALEADFNGINATVQINAAAIATMESYAASTYSVRLGAGGAAAGFEMVASDDPINGPASAIRFTADNILFDGTVLVEHLDVGSFSTAGLAVFGGDLQSDDFATGVSGWQITQAGDAEFNNLIVRESLVVGSVSDTASTYSAVEITPDDGDVFETLSYATPTASSEVVMVAATCQLRAPSGYSAVVGVDAKFRTKIDGIWTDWKFLPVADNSIYSGYVQGTWLVIEFGLVLSADYDDIEAQFIFLRDGGGGPPPEPTIRNYGITFVTVKR